MDQDGQWRRLQISWIITDLVHCLETHHWLPGMEERELNWFWLIEICWIKMPLSSGTNWIYSTHPCGLARLTSRSCSADYGFRNLLFSVRTDCQQGNCNFSSCHGNASDCFFFLNIIYGLHTANKCHEMISILLLCRYVIPWQHKMLRYDFHITLDTRKKHTTSRHFRQSLKNR